jgi:hypothetical protein
MSNNKQQTAVEWLQSIELERDLTLADWKQAKEMNKERMINFTEDWYFNGPLLGGGVDVVETIEQHYEQTYGGGEQ